MKVAVWDTYVKRNDGKIMHFDLLVSAHITHEQTILNFGKDYLGTKTFKTDTLNTKGCRLCHYEQASEEIILSIKNKGYHIIEIENCL